jgi:NADPH-dependent glutamate synthase beta subunit-like oxidoreductase
MQAFPYSNMNQVTPESNVVHKRSKETNPTPTMLTVARQLDFNSAKRNSLTNESVITPNRLRPHAAQQIMNLQTCSRTRPQVQQAEQKHLTSRILNEATRMAHASAWIAWNWPSNKCSKLAQQRLRAGRQVASEEVTQESHCMKERLSELLDLR